MLARDVSTTSSATALKWPFRSLGETLGGLCRKYAEYAPLRPTTPLSRGRAQAQLWSTRTPPTACAPHASPVHALLGACEARRGLRCTSMPQTATYFHQHLSWRLAVGSRTTMPQTRAVHEPQERMRLVHQTWLQSQSAYFAVGGRRCSARTKDGEERPNAVAEEKREERSSTPPLWRSAYART
jgi:hypothetical protein